MSRKVFTYIDVIIMFGLLYAAVLRVCYIDDAMMCQRAGYTSNNINLNMEGECTKEVSDGVTESVRVEDLMMRQSRVERQQRLSACVMSRSDPEFC